ncbi:MAG TPA: PKD domain-containing protein [Thermoanaerobaculia bacterium]|nr:PKD domain-containing protein [Thermoanaerobaculia bacterium]
MTALAGIFRSAPKNGVPELYNIVLADAVAGRPAEPSRGLPAVADVAHSLARAHGGTVKRVWAHALQGFSAELSEARARKLAEDPRVKSVEQDIWVSADVPACRAATIWNAPAPPQSPSSPQSTNCPNPDPSQDVCEGNWGLDRSDQQDLPLNNTFSFANQGTTAQVYVLDYGVRGSHQEFRRGSTSRVTAGFDARPDGDPGRTSSPGANNDCHGHGTHVAAIIGGLSFGISKNVNIHPVRVASCAEPAVSIYISNIVTGLNWIASDVSAHRTATEPWPAVVNYSGGNFEGAWRDRQDVAEAMAGVLGQRIVVVQSAGNHEPQIPSAGATWKDACDFTFGQRFPDVIVVGGTNYADGRWTKPGCTATVECGSIGGSCVDIWAPAQDIISAWYSGDTHACTLSGTSMAAPHVTGVVAAFLSANPTATIAEVQSALRSRGTWGRLQTNPAHAGFIGPDSDNVLLRSDVVSMGTNAAPATSFTVQCPGLQCLFDASTSTDENRDTLSYAWRFHDGSTATGINNRHDFTAAGDGWAVAEVSDGQATDHLRVRFTVGSDKPPVASFPQPSCSDLACTFDSSGSTDNQGIASRSWAFGDGSSSSAVAPSYTYAASGTYVVALTVTDNLGQTGTATRNVTVTQNAPLAPASVSAAAAGGTVTISWPASARSDGYRVERKVSSNQWQQVTVVEGGNMTSARDTPSAIGGVVVYRVFARSGETFSSPSASDVAWVGTFSDPVVASGFTVPVRAEHIAELRAAVNTLWSIAEQSAPLYPASELTASLIRYAPIASEHTATLAARLNAALQAAGVSKTVTFPTPPRAGEPILRSHITILRAGFD